MALKLNEAYPGRFNNPSPEYPQGSFKNRTTPTAEDGSYFEQQWANDHLAFLSSLLDGAGVDANGSVDEVGASQYYDALLQVIANQNADTLNAPVATVAAAATIDLTAGAPDTSQLAISGAGITINGFTVAAGRCYFVRFAGALTLTNNAAIVTQSGANITTAAGDTCIIRATAANVVEVLSYAPAGGWAKSLTASGYQKLPSGQLSQWLTSGSIAPVAAGGSGSVAVTFPITFPTAPFGAVVTPTGAGFHLTMTVDLLTASGCTIRYQNNGASSSAACSAYLIVHGN